MERFVFRHLGKFEFRDECPERADRGIGGPFAVIWSGAKATRSTLALTSAEIEPVYRLKIMLTRRVPTEWRYRGPLAAPPGNSTPCYAMAR